MKGQQSTAVRAAKTQTSCVSEILFCLLSCFTAHASPF